MRNHALVVLAAGENDRAIAELSEAAALDPKNAVLWSDLAAAHLQRGASLSDPFETVLALAAANRALQREPRLMAARFNRAVALERFSLRREAGADWDLVIRNERDPGWSREAQARARAVARPARAADWERDLQALKQAAEKGEARTVAAIVAGSPQRFREHVEEDLLPGWAALDKAQGPERDQRLRVARAIASGLAVSRGERMAADTIAQIDALSAAESPGARLLVRGLRAYGEGLSLVKEEKFSLARLRFEEARKLLAGQGSPFARWATYRIALCHYQRSEYQQARSVLLALGRDPARRRYRALHGRASWLLGLMDSIEGSPTASMTAFEASLADFRALNERANMARVLSFLAVDLDALGQRTKAWRRLHPALIESDGFGKPLVRSAVCEIASSMARGQGETEIALSFQNEVLRSAEATGDDLAIAEALRGRAALLAALGRKAEAAVDIAQARGSAERIPDLLARRSLEGDIWLVEGELEGRASPGEALAAFDQAVEILQRTSYHFRLGQALYQRGLIQNALGRSAEAESDFAAAIEESERQRKKIDSPEERISYFDRTREIFDTMISFQLERRRRPETALRFVEQAKARVLWDWMLAQPIGEPDLRGLDQTHSADTSPLQQDLPERAAVIEYAVLPRRTVIWVLRRGKDLEVETVETGSDALAVQIQELHRSLEEHRPLAFQKISGELYDILIRPVAHHLVPGERLVFVPDGALHALSFNLLRDQRTRRYLIQDQICSVAPSLRIFKASFRREEALARRHPGERALVVVAPDFDQKLYTSLSRLKAGETEASFARMFPGSRVLRHERATREAFLGAAGDFEIVHFGGHSIVNTDFPLLSQMLFANAPGDPARGVLYSGDILTQRFGSTRLVVLASCSTALGRISRTEGVESLARPFLAAGVPVVIASLWDVDDKAATDFFMRFYRHLAGNFDVARALRETQIDLMESATPLSWGAFEVIGANAPADVSVNPGAI